METVYRTKKQSLDKADIFVTKSWLTGNLDGGKGMFHFSLSKMH